jgi:hypothetical protein
MTRRGVSLIFASSQRSKDGKQLKYLQTSINQSRQRDENVSKATNSDGVMLTEAA